ncbi:site-specific integrase [Magnetovibrio sp. PR-2]|uniref:tyrosine-type recombinase/integrase n=1 Tax=Magnetovibrio sp. PR-2 TaxID=3120356 RepID=UPI002FCE497A
MATYRKRSNRWHVQVRRTGHPSQTKSFISKADAQIWARQIEAEMDKAVLPTDIRALDQLTVADLIKRYRDNVTINKRGVASEKKRLEVFLRYEWADKSLKQTTPQTFASYRDERLKQVRPATVVRELGILRSIFATAINEWNIPIPENPLVKVRKPKQPEARDRRLQEGELERLLLACEDTRRDWLRPCILIAIETGMRRGEILNVKWQDVNLDASTLTIPVTKTGHSRCIPLTPEAVAILQDRWDDEFEQTDVVFPASANAFRLSWERCKRRVAKTYPEIKDLRFHDLRHEAVSRFFEMGLSVPEVALISGHRDPRMLFRYTHLKAEDIVEKLALQNQ